MRGPRSPTPLVGRAGTRGSLGLQSASYRTQPVGVNSSCGLIYSPFYHAGLAPRRNSLERRLGSRQEHLPTGLAPSAAVSERPRPQGPGAGHLGSQPARCHGSDARWGSRRSLSRCHLAPPGLPLQDGWRGHQPPAPHPQWAAPLLLWLVFLLLPAQRGYLGPQPLTQGLRTVGGLRVVVVVVEGWVWRWPHWGGTTAIHEALWVGGCLLSLRSQCPVSSATPPPPARRALCSPKTAPAAFLATWQPHCRTLRPSASWPCSRRVSGRHTSPLAVPGPLDIRHTLSPQLIHAHTLPRICSLYMGSKRDLD